MVELTIGTTFGRVLKNIAQPFQCMSKLVISVNIVCIKALNLKYFLINGEMLN